MRDRGKAAVPIEAAPDEGEELMMERVVGKAAASSRNVLKAWPRLQLRAAREKGIASPAFPASPARSEALVRWITGKVLRQVESKDATDL